MSTLKKIRWLSAVAVIGASIASCTTEAGGGYAVPDDCSPRWDIEVADEGVLRVAAIQYPPYSSIEDGKVKGADGEIMAGFALEACLDIETQETTFAAAVSSISSGRADVAMGDLYRTEERASEVAMTDPVYLDEFGIISQDGYDTMASLEGQTIGTVQGYYFVADVQSVFGDDVRLLPDNVKMYQDLFAGRSDAALDSYAAAVQYLESTGESDYEVIVPPVDDRIPATGEQAAQSAFAYDDGAAGLGEALNEYVAELRESGRLAEILEANGLPASSAKVGSPRLL